MSFSDLVKCPICEKELEYGQMYEYRGVLACGVCIDRQTENRDQERVEVIEEQKHKTDRFKGLDMGDSAIGKANRHILKRDIEIAKKQSQRLKDYEQKTEK